MRAGRRWGGTRPKKCKWLFCLRRGWKHEARGAEAKAGCRFLAETQVMVAWHHGSPRPPWVTHTMLCFWLPCSLTYSDGNQQTTNTGLNILNRRRRVWAGSRMYVPVSLRLFWQPLSPVCLLIEILIEISEGDFNHRGVVHAYLCEPQRKKGAVTPPYSSSVREECALRHVSHSPHVTLAKLQQT